MHDSLQGDAASLTAADIDERATKLGMDVPRLDKCISNDRFADIIQRSVAEANTMQVSGTPTFIDNFTCSLYLYTVWQYEPRRRLQHRNAAGCRGPA
jgi:hypothetical protein